MPATSPDLQFLQALVHRPGFDAMVTIWDEDGYVGLLEEFDIAVRCLDQIAAAIEVRARDGSVLITLEGPELDRPSVRGVAERLTAVARMHPPRKPKARAFDPVSASFIGRPAQPPAPRAPAAEHAAAPVWQRAVLCRPGLR